MENKKADEIIERALKLNFDSNKTSGHSIDDFLALGENGDYDELDKCGCLFARKFATGKDKEICDKMYARIGVE